MIFAGPVWFPQTSLGRSNRAGQIPRPSGLEIPQERAPREAAALISSFPDKICGLTRGPGLNLCIAAVPDGGPTTARQSNRSFMRANLREWPEVSSRLPSELAATLE